MSAVLAATAAAPLRATDTAAMYTTNLSTNTFQRDSKLQDCSSPDTHAPGSNMTVRNRGFTEPAHKTLSSTSPNTTAAAKKSENRFVDPVFSQRLLHQIQTASMIGELRRIMIRYKANMQPKHVASMLYSMQRALSPKPPKKKQQQQQHPISAMTADYVPETTKLGAPPLPPPASGTRARAVTGSIQPLNSDQLLAFMLGDLGNMVWHRMDEFQPHELAQVLYAWGKLGWHPDLQLLSGVKSRLFFSSLSLLHVDAHHLSMALWGLAKMGHLGGDTLAITTPLLCDKIGDFNPQEIADVSWAGARSNTQPRKLMSKLAEQLAKLTTSTAVDPLPTPAAAATSDSSAEAPQQPVTAAVQPQHVAQVLQSLAVTNIYPAQAVTTLVHWLHGHTHAAAPDVVAGALQATAELRHYDAAFVQSAISALLPRLASCSCHDLARLCRAMAVFAGSCDWQVPCLPVWQSYTTHVSSSTLNTQSGQQQPQQQTANNSSPDSAVLPGSSDHSAGAQGADAIASSGVDTHRNSATARVSASDFKAFLMQLTDVVQTKLHLMPLGDLCLVTWALIGVLGMHNHSAPAATLQALETSDSSPPAPAGLSYHSGFSTSSFSDSSMDDSNGAGSSGHAVSPLVAVFAEELAARWDKCLDVWESQEPTDTTNTVPKSCHAALLFLAHLRLELDGVEKLRDSSSMLLPGRSAAYYCQGIWRDHLKQHFRKDTTPAEAAAKSLLLAAGIKALPRQLSDDGFFMIDYLLPNFEGCKNVCLLLDEHNTFRNLAAPTGPALLKCKLLAAGGYTPVVLAMTAEDGSPIAMQAIISQIRSDVTRHTSIKA